MTALDRTLEPAPTTGHLPVGKQNKRKRRRLVVWLLLAPGMLWLVLFFIVPMFTMALTALQEGSLETGYQITWNVAIFPEAVGHYLPQLGRSLLYAAITTVLCLAIAYPLAYTIAFKTRRFRGLMLALVVSPFFTSFLIRTMAWKTILSDQGVVVRTLDHLGVLAVLGDVGLTNAHGILASPFAVIAGLTYNFVPFMTLPLYASLSKIDTRLLEAAADLYARPSLGFAKIVWPLSLPGVVSGTLLTFIPASGDYVNAQLLGSPHTRMIGNAIQNEYLNTLDYPTASALAVTFMAIIVVIVSVYLSRTRAEDLL